MNHCLRHTASNMNPKIASSKKNGALTAKLHTDCPFPRAPLREGCAQSFKEAICCLKNKRATRYVK